MENMMPRGWALSYMANPLKSKRWRRLVYQDDGGGETVMVDLDFPAQ
jgi:hypothetical protein